MSVIDVAILAGSLVLTGLLAWYFFGPKKSRLAELTDGVQIVKVTVKGGYSPDVIQVTSGVPVRMMFDRQESGDCSSRVVFPDFKVNQILPAFKTTTVDFLPEELGEYEFACGMGMFHGTLRVVGQVSPDTSGASSMAPLTGEAAAHEHACPDDVAAGLAPPVALATVTNGTQIVGVTVRGGYSPGVVRVAPGVPVRLVVNRQEDSACSERLLVPDLGVDVVLPAFARTTVQLPAMDEDTHEFTCGMGMLHGRILVSESAGVTGPGGRGDAHVMATAVAAGGGDLIGARAAPEPAEGEERERNAQISDLTRRVIFGGLLTAPVLFAVMFTGLFSVTWMPELLMNLWFQLALITPVMFYTGWPIHRTGWLALSHRTADMNSLVTLGTIAAYGYSLVVTFFPGTSRRSTSRRSG
jgi:Cu+-exporting ATPase